ncbi:hypothetical protein HYQ46_012779 [Verticillium longisporum]|nr:hypothetical protein HYQ46_012779 [Verticillium longisporum]
MYINIRHRSDPSPCTAQMSSPAGGSLAGLFGALDAALGDEHVRHGCLEDGLSKHALHLHLETTGSRLGLGSLGRNGIERLARKVQTGGVRLEEGGVLGDEAVTGLGQDAEQVVEGQGVQGAYVGDAAYELGDEAKGLQVCWCGEV